MKKIAVLLVFCCLVLSAAAVAGEAEAVTVEGKVMCARCVLHDEGLTECQNVLVVEGGEEATHYYLSGTEANEEFGDVCMATPIVRATGTVSEKDGHTWLAATKIEPVEEEDKS